MGYIGEGLGIRGLLTLGIPFRDPHRKDSNI